MFCRLVQFLRCERLTQLQPRGPLDLRRQRVLLHALDVQPAQKQLRYSVECDRDLTTGLHSLSHNAAIESGREQRVQALLDVLLS